MLEMRAIVVQTQGDEASVRVMNSGCGHCSSEGGCGSGTLSKLFCGSKPRLFTVRNDVRAKVGDEVQVSLPDGVLLSGVARMYMLPLILLLSGGFVGLGLAGETASRDAWAASGAFIGLLLGFVLARFSLRNTGQAVISFVATSHHTS